MEQRILVGASHARERKNNREHSQEVRRGCKGLPPQQHTQHGSLLQSELVQNTRHTKNKLRNLNIKLRAIFGLHLVAAAHRADLRR